VSAVILGSFLVPMIAIAQALGVQSAWERVAVGLMRSVLERWMSPRPNPAPPADTVSPE
jgi:hypothetical protein